MLQNDRARGGQTLFLEGTLIASGRASIADGRVGVARLPCARSEGTKASLRVKSARCRARTNLYRSCSSRNFVVQPVSEVSYPPADRNVLPPSARILANSISPRCSKVYLLYVHHQL